MELSAGYSMRANDHMLILQIYCRYITTAKNPDSAQEIEVWERLCIDYPVTWPCQQAPMEMPHLIQKNQLSIDCISLELNA